MYRHSALHHQAKAILDSVSTGSGSEKREGKGEGGKIERYPNINSEYCEIRVHMA